MSDDEEYKVLDPLAFLEEYLKNEEAPKKRDMAKKKLSTLQEMEEMARKRDDFRQMMSNVVNGPSPMDPVKIVYDPTSVPPVLMEPAERNPDVAHWRGLAEKVNDELREVRRLLAGALEVGNGGARTAMELAEGARQTLQAYRIISDAHRKKIVELEDLLARSIQQAKSDGAVELYDGRTLVVHRRGDCHTPDRCTIHNPSDHRLNSAPRAWIRGRMYRVCSHDQKHPDPDDTYFRELAEEGDYQDADDQKALEHDAKCDGCCDYP